MLRIFCLSLFLIFTQMFEIAKAADAEAMFRDIDKTSAVDDSLLEIQITSNKEGFTAKITSLTEAGKKSGIDKLLLKGSESNEAVNKDNLKKKNSTNTDSNHNSKKRVINWNKAVLQDSEEKLSPGLVSMLLSTEEIPVNTNITAKGNLNNLFTVFKELKLQQKEKKTETKSGTDYKEYSQIQTSAGGSAASNTASPQKNPEIKTKATNFEVIKDPVITVTSDGCEIKIDEPASAAILQERVLTDGVQTSPCSASLTKYPLTKLYNQCPVVEDVNRQVAYEQYTLGYINPKTQGRVDVKPCTIDPDKTMAMVENSENCPDFVSNNVAKQQTKLVYDYKGIEKTVIDCRPSNINYEIVKIIDSCGLRHDFNLGVSYRQKKLAYIKNGQNILIRDSICEDDKSESYQHVTTKDGCITDVNGSDVIFFSRKYINIDGVRNYISDCIPESSKAKLLEENCVSPKYTNDFLTNQSFLNKNYYYIDSGKRVIVANCVTSEVTYQHYKDVKDCSVINDDINKTTTTYAKTYITEDNKPDSLNKIYITDCQQLGLPASYNRSSYKWQVKNSQFVNIKTSQLGASAYVDIIGPDYATKSPSLTKNYNWTKDIVWDGNYRWNCNPQKTYCVQAQNNDVLLKSNAEYCLNNQLNLSSWMTFDGIIIDIANSDQEPYWTLTDNTISWMQNETKVNDPVIAPPAGAYASWSKPLGNYECTMPSCKMTLLEKLNLYIRGDGTIFVDTANVIETKHVCGNGDKLLK